MGTFKVNLPSVFFRPEIFSALIRDRGNPVSWQKGSLCPCVRADQKGITSFSCGLCTDGYQYLAPETVTAVVTNITGQRNAAAYGELFMGGIFVTVDGDSRVGIGDRIVLEQSTARYSELCVLPTTTTTSITNSGDTVLNVKHTRKFPAPGNKVMYAAINGSTFSYTGKTDTTLFGIPTTGSFSLPAGVAAQTQVKGLVYRLRYNPIQLYDARSDSQVLNIGLDVQSSDDGYLWFIYAAKANDTQYSVLYDSFPVYIVKQMAHEFRDQILRQYVDTPTLERLPLAFACAKEFIFGSKVPGQ